MKLTQGRGDPPRRFSNNLVHSIDLGLKFSPNTKIGGVMDGSTELFVNFGPKNHPKTFFRRIFTWDPNQSSEQGIEHLSMH